MELSLEVQGEDIPYEVSLPSPPVHPLAHFNCYIYVVFSFHVSYRLPSLSLPFVCVLSHFSQEDVLNNRFSAKSWLRYVAFKRDAPPRVRFMLYERALQALPASYKLWHRYLLERKARPSPCPLLTLVPALFPISLLCVRVRYLSLL
jgi:hypothetical protein